MTSPAPRSSTSTRRARERGSRPGHAEAARRRQRRVVALAVAAVTLVLAGMVAARLLLAPQETSQADAPVPPAIMAALTDIPPSSFDAVGRGSASLPVRVHGPVSRGPSGRPLITYVGAEYCPFCAAERWPLVVALSRFGQFANLRLSHSAADDIYPSTPTFTFVGATYTSEYVEFSAVELQGNVRVGGRYPPLQTPTAAQQKVLRTYNAPPYVAAASAGAIPFLDVADQYIVSGASFDVGLLQRRSWQAIADSLGNPSTEQARAILGTANVLTAAICSATGDTPGDVCGQPAVRALQGTLAELAPPAGAR